MKKVFIVFCDIASVIDNLGACFGENNIKTLKGFIYYQVDVLDSIKKDD